MVFKVMSLFAGGIEDIMDVVKLDGALGNKCFPHFGCYFQPVYYFLSLI